jgi:hypothetical protein
MHDDPATMAGPARFYADMIPVEDRILEAGFARLDIK